MKSNQKLAYVLAASGMLSGYFHSSAQAAAVPVFNFPDPSSYAILYDDFYSFSMPILSAAATGFTDQTPTYGNGSLYYINTANTIQDALVVGTGSGGSQNNTDLGLTGFYEDGYDFPNVNGNGVATFSTTTATNPDNNGVPNLDQATTWDISLASLRDYLTIDGVLYDMVAYFNNNQQNDDGPDLFGDNNLWAYAEVTVEDTDGGGGSQTFYFRDLVSQYTLIMNASADLADNGIMDGSATYTNPFPDNGGMYVLSGGTVTLCFDYNNGLDNTLGSTPVACTPGTYDWSYDFEHNLGQNDVAYGITSLELNAIIHDLNSVYDVMRVRVDFDQLNNGYENLYIGAACVNCGSEVPEPNALALFALGLIGVGWMSRRHLMRS